MGMFILLYYTHYVYFTLLCILRQLRMTVKQYYTNFNVIQSIQTFRCYILSSGNAWSNQIGSTYTYIICNAQVHYSVLTYVVKQVAENKKNEWNIFETSTTFSQQSSWNIDMKLWNQYQINWNIWQLNYCNVRQQVCLPTIVSLYLFKVCIW